MPNLWIDYIKHLSTTQKISYNCALCEAGKDKEAYVKWRDERKPPKEKKPKKEPKGKKTKKELEEEETKEDVVQEEPKLEIKSEPILIDKPTIKAEQKTIKKQRFMSPEEEEFEEIDTKTKMKSFKLSKTVIQEQPKASIKPKRKSILEPDIALIMNINKVLKDSIKSKEDIKKLTPEKIEVIEKVENIINEVLKDKVENQTIVQQQQKPKTQPKNKLLSMLLGEEDETQKKPMKDTRTQEEKDEEERAAIEYEKRRDEMKRREREDDDEDELKRLKREYKDLTSETTRIGNFIDVDFLSKDIKKVLDDIKKEDKEEYKNIKDDYIYKLAKKYKELNSEILRSLDYSKSLRGVKNKKEKEEVEQEIINKTMKIDDIKNEIMNSVKEDNSLISRLRKAIKIFSRNKKEGYNLLKELNYDLLFEVLPEERISEDDILKIEEQINSERRRKQNILTKTKAKKEIDEDEDEEDEEDKEEEEKKYYSAFDDLFAPIKKGKGLGPSIRRDYSPQIRDLLTKIGNKNIVKMEVQRVPIESALKGLLNIVSLGQYEKQTQKLGYDRIFHLSLIIYLEDGKKYVVEKNEVINISQQIPPMKKGGARMIVPMNKKITVNQLLEDTRTKQGSQFFLYDAFSRNCQMFIRDLLINSGFMTPELQTFIMQDAAKILEGLPWYMSSFSKGLTNLGAQFNRIIYGKGRTKK